MRLPLAGRPLVRLLLLAILCLAVPGAAAQPLLWAVVPDLPGPGPGDEGFALWSPQDQPLDGWSITDGEATWTFPPGTVLDAGTPAWFAAGLESWNAHGMPPATLWSGPQLANGGDELLLMDPQGAVVDAFAWGTGSTPEMEGTLRTTSAGLVYRRSGSPPADTDHADDWRTPRMHRVGESSLDRPVWDVDAVTVYASPDSSHAVLTTLLEGAQRRVALHVYELRSPSLVDALADVAARVPTDVLVHRSPVGMDTHERYTTAWALSQVEEAGGTAWLSGTARYDYHHLKVLVVDDAVAVQSENWVPSGVPADPTWGNRGWGVVLWDAEAAAWFADLMHHDRAAWDTTRFDLATFAPGYEPPVRFAPRSGDHQGVPAQTFQGPVRVRPAIAPDHTLDPAQDPMAQAAASATRRLLVQQLDLSQQGSNRLGWSGDDPLLHAIVAASENGATVRVQAAPGFAADDRGNAEALAWLAARGIETSQVPPASVATLHNKGIVADDTVVVGSVNGNHHSRSENREAAVIIEDARVANWYAGRFASDWPSDPFMSHIPGPAAPCLLVIVALAASRWRSTSSPGSRSR